ncbi:activating molecule in BECN1-regulated autophagy protein 1A-like isoform X2 [Ptychodera flava]|uniref:activating molecule in BECN1-regulated autophagy protein 1A-like isoform X2 n=1 Tax=Ptychodera flava TaxID=63121 RepID=UPI00396A1C6D
MTNSTTESFLHNLVKREVGLFNGRHRVSLDRFVEDKAAVFSTDNKPCELAGQPRATFLMSFSPDGNLMASNHGDHNVHVTDVRTGENTHTLIGHPRTPWCVSFHPTSNDILASGCLAGEVRIWDLHGGSESWKADTDAAIASLAFHPTDQVLAIATDDRLYLWDWGLPTPFTYVKTANPKEKIRLVKFDPIGHYLLTGISNIINGDSDDELDLSLPSSSLHPSDAQERNVVPFSSYDHRLVRRLRQQLIRQSDSYNNPQDVADAVFTNPNNLDVHSPNREESGSNNQPGSSHISAMPHPMRNQDSALSGTSDTISQNMQSLPGETASSQAAGGRNDSSTSDFEGFRMNLAAALLHSTAQVSMNVPSNSNRQPSNTEPGFLNPSSNSNILHHSPVTTRRRLFNPSAIRVSVESDPANSLSADVPQPDGQSSSSNSDSDSPPGPPYISQISQQHADIALASLLPEGDRPYSNLSVRRMNSSIILSRSRSGSSVALPRGRLEFSGTNNEPASQDSHRFANPEVSTSPRYTTRTFRRSPLRSSRLNVSQPRRSMSDDSSVSSPGSETRRARMTRFGFQRSTERSRLHHFHHHHVNNLHQHYSTSVFDDTNRPSPALHSAINRAIAGAFAGNGETAVASNIVNTTHRLQWWDFTSCQLPNISDSDVNVIVPHCKLHNDASCDISQDGTMLAAFVPSHRGFPDDGIMAVYSLQTYNFGDCLFTKSFGPNAISVSISPANNYVMVGLASRRLHWHVTSKQMVAQIFRLREAYAGEDSCQHIQNVMHPCDVERRTHISVNSAKWLPFPGGGVVYGTNRGDLHVCRIRLPPIPEDPPRVCVDNSRTPPRHFHTHSDNMYARRNIDTVGRVRDYQMLGVVGLGLTLPPETNSTSTQTPSVQVQSASTQTDSTDSSVDNETPSVIHDDSTADTQGDRAASRAGSGDASGNGLHNTDGNSSASGSSYSDASVPTMYDSSSDTSGNRTDDDVIDMNSDSDS